MIIQEGLKSDVIHKKHVIGAHPIIQYFIDRLRIDEIIGSYVKQDKRIKLSTEKTLSVLIHNILTTHLPITALIDIFWKTLVESDISPLTQEEREELEKGKIEFEKGETIKWENLR